MIHMARDSFDTHDKPGRAGLLRKFYEADWADPQSRALALRVLRNAALPSFEWRLEARRPPLEVPAGGLYIVGEGIDEDFTSYVREVEEQSGEDGDELVVRGAIVARTRFTRESVRRPFEDRWRFNGNLPIALVSR